MGMTSNPAIFEKAVGESADYADALEELERRLRGRGSETEETIRRRFDNALSEIREIVWYDYVVMNDNLDAAIERLRAVYTAEQCRRERMMEKIKPFFDRSGGM